MAQSNTIEATTYRISGIFFLLFLLSVFLLSTSGVMGNKDSVGVSGYADIIRGKWASRYEAKFNEALPSYEASKSLWSYGVYSVYNIGKSGVIVGANGWLFTDEELALNKGHQNNIISNTEYIVAVRDFLKSKNTSLIVTLVPAKARVYKQHLGTYRFPSYNAGLYESVLDSLNQQNVVTVDTNAVMQEHKDDLQLFLKADTHWTQTGAAMTAEATYAKYAQSLKQNVNWEEENYRVNDQELAIVHKGDLLEFIPVGEFFEKAGLETETLKTLSLIKQESDEPEEIDLFGDDNPPITLVGTSYSANKLWGFDQYLKEIFQSDILNAADEGQGPFQTMETYLNNDAFQNNPPQLLIWEIPERYISVNYNLSQPK